MSTMLTAHPNTAARKPAAPAAGSAPRPLDQRSIAAATAALPPTGTKRWVIRRKAAVVSAVRVGVLTLEDACQRYRLSVEEFLSWQRLIDRHGMRGLRATRVQEYRETEVQPAG